MTETTTPPVDNRTAQTLGQAAGASTHPEEIRASVDLRIGNSVSLQATVRTTPAGLVSAGVMVSTVLLAATALVWAARRQRDR